MSPPSAPRGATGAFVDLKGHTQLAVITFYISAIALSADLMIDVILLLSLISPQITWEYTIPFAFVAILRFPATTLTAIAFGSWMHKAQQNVCALGCPGLSHTPRWAMWYLFVPLINIYRGPQVMSELARASKDPLDWINRPEGRTLQLWKYLWVVWLLGSLVFFLLRIGTLYSSIGPPVRAIDLLANGACVALCLTSVFLVKQVWLDQVHAMAMNRENEVSPYPR